MELLQLQQLYLQLQLSQIFVILFAQPVLPRNTSAVYQ